MESHDDNTTSAGTQQGRRLACERCRSQKLKCEKSNIQDCCQRCRKADVQCSFGMALPPGRPRANPPRPPPPSEPTKDENDQTIIASPGYHVDQAFAFGHAADVHNNPFHDDGIIDVPFTDDVLSGYTAWSVALSGTCEGSKPSDGLMAMEHLHPTMANAPDSFMMIDTHPSTPPSQPPQIHPTNSPTCVRGSESLASYKHMQAPTGSLAALVRRAADLCDNMYELRIKYHDGTHSELDAPGQFPVNMSGEVLQAANDFLTLLRCFFWEEPSGRSTPSLISNTSSSRTNTSPILPEQPRRVIFDADRPAALTLIASYQRLLDLYLLYYLAVYEYLRNTEPAWRRSQPIWNDLNVGGASLGEFGDLHIKLIMQATARVLEDIEGALGLSPACRVSCPSAVEGDGGGNGVLGTIVTTRFVEQCIAEGFTVGSEHGQGAIARIREVAASLTAALDPPGGR
ncbi:hypothetical protein F5883DRAFT_533708 [Diaporthe sp. PMI_573]|nr:hypothetical protein F5883DRAFT_533708 [Diaporthaceae sp. PMI_573]